MPGNAAKASPAEDETSTPTIVAELVTAKVVRGDSLWRISRTMLGHGVRYTQIYAANTQQIRDPRLIYPGQVFVLPQQQ
jgi:nucleoid-associated protein YgaU